MMVISPLKQVLITSSKISFMIKEKLLAKYCNSYNIIKLESGAHLHVIKTFGTEWNLLLSKNV